MFTRLIPAYRLIGQDGQIGMARTPRFELAYPFLRILRRHSADNNTGSRSKKCIAQECVNRNAFGSSQFTMGTVHLRGNLDGKPSWMSLSHRITLRCASGDEEAQKLNRKPSCT